MILRISQKLGQKIKESPARILPLDANPFADWSGHVFTADRAQYVLLTNTTALYSTLMHGAGITTDSRLLERGLDSLRDVLTDDGLEFLYLRLIAPSTATIQFSKVLNRSVTGSINDLVQCAKHLLANGELSPHQVARRLNEMPMSVIHYANPREALKSLELERGEG
ncbi:MAG: hypothetical protein WD971_08755 [Pirellulales bacterium]